MHMLSLIYATASLIGVAVTLVTLVQLKRDQQDGARKVADLEGALQALKLELEVQKRTNLQAQFEPVSQTKINDLDALARSPDLRLGNKFIAAGVSGAPYDGYEDLL